MTKILPLIAALILAFVSGLSAAESTLLVKYVSAENIYLSGGQADGVAVGDHVTVTSKGNCLTDLEVVYVAEHSASCKVVSGTCTIAAGDKAVLIPAARPDTTQVVDTTVAKPRDTTLAKVVPPPAPRSYAPKPPPNISGDLSILYYNWHDKSASNLDFSQVTSRFDFRARRLFGQDITFTLRTRGRYDHRQRSYSSLVPQNAWENRVWEFSLSYESPHSPNSMYVGRILSRRISSAGYIDGLLLEHKLSDDFRVGVFGGQEPQYAYNTGQVSLNKGGGYLTYLHGDPGKSYFEQSIAAIGQYHAMDVSRELIASQGRYSTGNRWGYYHTAEIDINRGWRKEKTGKTFSLSSLYLGTYYRLSSAIRLNVSYDNRVNYWTIDTKSLVDSLFDDHLRQGVRTQLDISLPLHIQTSTSYGLNKRTGDPSATKAYSFYLAKTGMLHSSSVTSVQYAGFRGPFEHGDNYSVRVTDNLIPRAQFGLAYGVYNYTVSSIASVRKNSWFETSVFADLSRRYYMMGSVEFDSGDDIKGTRLQTDLGLRF